MLSLECVKLRRTMVREISCSCHNHVGWNRRCVARLMFFGTMARCHGVMVQQMGNMTQAQSRVPALTDESARVSDHQPCLVLETSHQMDCDQRIVLSGCACQGCCGRDLEGRQDVSAEYVGRHYRDVLAMRSLFRCCHRHHLQAHSAKPSSRWNRVDFEHRNRMACLVHYPLGSYIRLGRYR